MAARFIAVALIRPPVPVFVLRDKGAWRSYVTLPANRVLQTSPYLTRPSYITPGVDQVRLPDRVSLDLVRVEIIVGETEYGETVRSEPVVLFA